MKNSVSTVQWNAGMIEGAVALLGNKEMKEAAKQIRHLVDVVALYSDKTGTMEDAIKKLDRQLFDLQQGGNV